MATKIGNGFSQNPDALAAATEAIQQAIKNMKGIPDLLVVFASTVYDPQVLLREIKAKSKTSNIVGCTTAGEFTETGLRSNSVTIMAIQSDNMVFEKMEALGLKHNHSGLKSLFKDFKKQTKDMFAKGYIYSTVMMFLDPFVGNGEGVVEAIKEQADDFCQIVGGAAGDDGKFLGTKVFYGEEALSGAGVFVKIFSKNKMGIGAKHGMKNCTSPMTVTRSVGSELKEIDGKPAFEAYRVFAKTQGISLTYENAPSYMMNQELAIQSELFTKIRAPLKVNFDGSLFMAAEVPEGSLVCIVDSDANQLTNAAHEAAREAKENLGNKKAAGVLVFDCICRKSILGKNFGYEIKAIQTAFEQNTPMVGLATYGEIARYSGLFNGWHNSTSVICAFPE